MGVIKISPVRKAASEKNEDAKKTKAPSRKTKDATEAKPKKSTAVKPEKTSTKKAPAKTKKAAKTVSPSAKTTRKSTAGSRVLIIVESPSKAATLSNMLGKGYIVKSSKGHMKDLPKSRLAVDIEHGFTPEYILVKGKAALKNELLKLASDAKSILLASDPDREGEAIAWHLADILGVNLAEKCRVRFYEITENAVKLAVQNPDYIDLNKVDAQQARRILDRLVGYTLSPLLWKKIRYGLSAGRVQVCCAELDMRTGARNSGIYP